MGPPSRRPGERGRRVRGRARYRAPDDLHRRRAARFARRHAGWPGRAPVAGGGSGEAGDSCSCRDSERRRCSLGRPFTPESRERPDRPTCADMPGGAICITAGRTKQGRGAERADRCLTSDGPGYPVVRCRPAGAWRSRIGERDSRCSTSDSVSVAPAAPTIFEAIAQPGEHPPVERKGAGSSPAGLAIGRDWGFGIRKARGAGSTAWTPAPRPFSESRIPIPTPRRRSPTAEAPVSEAGQ